MIKLVINIVAFVLCVGIIALGGYQTVKQSDFTSIQKDFIEAMTPVAPPQNPTRAAPKPINTVRTPTRAVLKPISPATAMVHPILWNLLSIRKL